MKKYAIEIKHTEDNDFTTWEYEAMKENKELYYLEALDFAKLLEMEEGRQDDKKKLTEQQKIKILFEFLEEYDNDYIQDFKELAGIEKLNNYDTRDVVHEYLEDGGFNERDIFEELAPKFNLKFGTVGYSQWSYFLALPDIPISYINDLYEGYNFMDFDLYEIHEDGSMTYEESYTQYADVNEFEKFDEIIKGLYGDIDYKIIKNENLFFIKAPENKVIEMQTTITTTYKVKETTK